MTGGRKPACPNPSSIRPVVSIQNRLVTASQPGGQTYGHGETDDDSKYCANIASRCKDAKMRYDTFVDVFRPIATRYLASSARAKTPAASGAAADVPE